MEKFIKENANILYTIAGGLLLYYLFGKPSAGNTTNPASNDPTGNDGSAPNVPIYVFNASKVAEDLYEAMRYTGTEEDAIIASLQHVNQSQFAQVVAKFGKRQYNKSLGNQVNPTAWIDDLPFVDLQGWLRNELSDSDYKILRLKYPNYL